MIKLVSPLHQVANDRNQVAPHGAADAAIIHLEDFFVCIGW